MAANKRGSQKRIPWITLLAIGLCVTIVLAYARAAHMQRNAPPDITMELHNPLGKKETLRQLLAQDKPVVINFWAAFCPPCRAEMPGFEAVHQSFGDDVIFMGIDIGYLAGLGSEDDAIALVDELGVTYKTATSTGDDPMTAYGIYSIPTTLFFNRDGKLVSTHSGYLPEDQLRKVVTELAGLPAQ